MRWSPTSTRPAGRRSLPSSPDSARRSGSPAPTLPRLRRSRRARSSLRYHLGGWRRGSAGAALLALCLLFLAVAEIGHVFLDRALDLLAVDLGGRDAALDAIEHALHQVVVVLVAIGLQIEVGGHFPQPLVADVLDVLLHEAVVVAPADAGGAHRRLLGPRGDLVGMQIVQIELIDQRLLHLLVQDQIAVGVDLAAVVLHRLWHVAVDVNGLAV